jgi:hypothetical protein
MQVRLFRICLRRIILLMRYIRLTLLKCRPQPIGRNLVIVHRWMPVQQHLLSCEQFINLLEGEVLSLGVEEVNEREEAGVEYWRMLGSFGKVARWGVEIFTSEIDVCPPLNIAN